MRGKVVCEGARCHPRGRLRSPVFVVESPGGMSPPGVPRSEGAVSDEQPPSCVRIEEGAHDGDRCGRVSAAFENVPSSDRGARTGERDASRC
jgi:hypothetical protein